MELTKREQRSKLVADARAIMDIAKKEARNTTAAEQETYDKLFTDADKLDNEIKADETRAAEQERKAKRLEEMETESRQSQGRKAPETRGNPGSLERRETPEYMAAYRAYLRHRETRNLQADSDILGGYLRVPRQVSNEIIKALTEQVFIRPLSQVTTLSGAVSLGIPTITARMDDALWQGELSNTAMDDTMRFGLRELRPHNSYKRIKVSNDLLNAVPNIEAVVNEEFIRVFSATEENAFLTGDGQGKPVGIFVTSGGGISSSRDVATGNAATYPTFDGLLEAQGAMKEGHLKFARWIFHRTARTLLRKLKDGEGQYIWQDSTQAGSPAVLLGNPVDISEFAPSTFTTGLYAGALVDWRYYRIADVSEMGVMRLDELYQATNEVGFHGKRQTDGMLVLSDALVRVKLG